MTKAQKIILASTVATATLLTAALSFFSYLAITNTENTPDLNTSLSNVELLNNVVLDGGFEPFYVPVRTEGGILYVGYGYGFDSEPKAVQAFYYDTTTREVTVKKTISELLFADVCAADSKVILSSDGRESVAVSVTDDEINTITTELECTSKVPLPPDCNDGFELYRQLLPGREEQLSMCYNQNNMQVTFYLIEPSRGVVNLGLAGTSTGGSGRFVVQPGVEPGTYLVHHTRSAIAESAVVLDLNTNSVSSATLPDLTDVRPSRGFGAGEFGIKIHPATDGYVIEGEGGQTYLIQNESTTVLADDVITGSVAVYSGGCSITLLVNEDDGVTLKEFNVCQ